MSDPQWDGPALTIRVLGLPVGQGRITTFGKGRITTFGKGRSVHSNAKTLLPWREQVQHAAEAAIRETANGWFAFPLTCAVSLHAFFTVKKPVSAPKKRVTYPTTRPDLSHLVRAVEDALTAAGVYKDDSQIIHSQSTKGYPGEQTQGLPVPGVIVRVYTVREPAAGERSFEEIAAIKRQEDS